MPDPIPTREYCGQQVPTRCILCQGDLDWELAERSSSSSVQMAEGYDPRGWAEFLASYIPPTPDGPTAYEAWEAQGKAGVVHAICMEDHGWEIS